QRLDQRSEIPAVQIGSAFGPDAGSRHGRDRTKSHRNRAPQPFPDNQKVSRVDYPEASSRRRSLCSQAMLRALDLTKAHLQPTAKFPAGKSASCIQRKSKAARPAE